jgi:hypothetical protein
LNTPSRQSIQRIWRACLTLALLLPVLGPVQALAGTKPLVRPQFRGSVLSQLVIVPQAPQRSADEGDGQPQVRHPVLEVSEASTYDAVIQSMLDQVDPQILAGYVGDLSGENQVLIDGSPYRILTRYSRTTTPLENATQYAYDHFQRLGLAVSFHNYDLPNTGTRRNVIAEQTGQAQSETIFLISAHLDDTSGFDPMTVAPGADDNASGAAGVLAAADILSQFEFDCTLRYALFTGEEQGLYGSQAYADSLSSSNQDVQGVLNLDMIAYNSDEEPILDLHVRPGNPGDQAIAETFSGAVSGYGLDLVPQIQADGMGYSDHYSFWDTGFPATLAIEDGSDFNPNYHSIDDTLDTLDLDYFTDFVKASVATLAHLGCLQEGTLSGMVTEMVSAAPISGAWIQAIRDDSKAWHVTTEVDGSYQMSLPTGQYMLQVSATGYQPITADGIEMKNQENSLVDFSLGSCTPVEGAELSFTPGDPSANQSITFSAGVPVSSTLPVQFDWSFGDGTTARTDTTSASLDPTGAFLVSTIEHAYPFTSTLHSYPFRVTFNNNCTPSAQLYAAVRVSSLSRFLPLLVSGQVPRYDFSRDRLEFQFVDTPHKTQ